jgi:SsrA-binding protein
MNNSLITKNKKAYFDYEVLETYEAWIELFWHEVKSVRAGQVNLKWAYISFIWTFPIIKWMHITPWKTLVNRQNLAWDRDRKIFLHKKTISQLSWKQKEGWFAIIPLELYFKWSLIKLRVWLCKWRKEYDKKQVLKERTLDKEAKMMMKKFI